MGPKLELEFLMYHRATFGTKKSLTTLITKKIEKKPELKFKFDFGS